MKRQRLKYFCCEPPTYGLNLPASHYATSGVRILRTTDIGTDGKIAPGTGVYASPDAVPPHLLLRDGDILLSRSGTLGRSLLFKEGVGPATHAGYLVRFRVSASNCSAYVAYCAQSRFFQDAVRADAIVSTIGNFNAEKYANVCLPWWPRSKQNAIADFLDRETVRIDALIQAKRAIVKRLYERCEAEIRLAIGQSGLGRPNGETVELRRVLRRYKDPAPPGTPLVTAYRDGQVTLRELRRAEGYTEAAEDAGYFKVHAGDVVIHGLDGFAGAIGTAEASGACSPVYHVLRPLDGSDPQYWGLMLRVLALTGYLGLFVTSTRERAYDMRNWEVMGRIPVPVVSNSDQQRIGNMLRRIPALRDLFNRSIALLQERRHALITAAVNGKLDIPEVT